jgi:transposase-like protein
MEIGSGREEVLGRAGEAEEGRSPTGASPAGAVGAAPQPRDPEVRERPARRRFSAEYKIRILEEADQCRKPGDFGALLRREGLYASNLTYWRKQRSQGILAGLKPARRGRKPVEKNPLSERVAQLEKENQRLQDRLEKAETIIEVQKKVSELLGRPLPARRSEESEGKD